MKTTPLACFAMFLLSSQAGAESLSVTKSYSYSHPTFAALDTACISGFTEKILPKFIGLTEIILDSNAIIDTHSGALATYAGVEFVSEYGTAEGTISCVFSANGQNVTDVGVVFEGRGLGGYQNHPVKMDPDDPASWKATAVASSFLN